jgi:hypothetical protein
MLIALYILTTFGEGAADDLDVTLIVNPKATEISAGAEKIVITAEAFGKNLSFMWRLSGPGKLEAEGAAAFYIPPQTIESSSEYAIVTVTVKEASGQATVKSITFAILPSPDQAPTPLPEPDSPEKEGGSKKGLVALGLVAIAAIGGGIALAGGGGGDSSGVSLDPPPATCAGTWVGGYCWYLSADGQSCTGACASHGGYHTATRFYAGSDGTDSHCLAVLAALGAPPADYRSSSHCNGGGAGCHYSEHYYDETLKSWTRCTAPSTTAETTFSQYHYRYYRACACQE